AGAELQPYVAQPRAPRRALAKQKARARQQTPVIGRVMAFDVSREEVLRESAVAAHVGERRFSIAYRVRTIDVPLARAAWLSEASPHRAHVVVERNPPVRAIAKREVERQRDSTTEWVIGDHSVCPVRAIDGPAAIDERRHAAHLFSRPNQARGIVDDRSDEAREGAGGCIERDER